jgi:hypothetical protein
MPAKYVRRKKVTPPPRRQSGFEIESGVWDLSDAESDSTFHQHMLEQVGAVP